MTLLETERLIIRTWELSDSADLYEYAKSDLVGPNAGWKPHKDEEESKGIIKMFLDGDETFAVELKTENKVIGGVGLHRRTPDESLKELEQREIGYVLNPFYWGNGYIPEAVKGLLDHGFNKMKLDLIWCGYFEGNNNSKRVCEKSGFIYQCTKDRELPLLDNKIVKEILCNISRDDYGEKK